MRNLKRALSLALASVMLLGMMVVGTSAASYPDIDENDNVEAIEVLNAVNVMIGRQGNFEPDEAVNRHEMAVIMAKLVLGVDTADNYVGSHPFTDVVPWADRYVAACYENGLIAGTSATTYGGSQPLTAVQAAAMMLRALGYKDLSVGATDWRAPVTAMANQIRLFNGVASNPSQQLNRNQVAQLALNTLKSPMVNLVDNTITWNSNEGQVVMASGGRQYIALSSREAYARAINRVESAGTSASQIGGWTVELGEHLYNGDLKLNDVTDPFQRPARQWEYDGKEIGTYIKEELLDFEKVGEVTGKDLYDVLGKTAIDEYTMIVALDGVTDPDIVYQVNGYDGNKDNLGAKHNQHYVFDASDLNRSNKGSVGGTGTGVLTQVFVDPNYDNGGSAKDGRIWIAVINTYLARATQDYDTRREELALNAYSVRENRDEYVALPKDGSYETVRLGVEEYPVVKDADKDDAFLVTFAEGEVQTIVPAEVMEAVTISSFKSKDNLVVDGTQYKFTTTAGFDADALKNYTGGNVTNLKDITYNVFLDAYGNTIGVQEVDAKKNYVFLAAIDINDSNLVNGTANAKAVFLDGTVDTIRVNLDKSTLDWYKNGDEPGGYNKNSILNTWCTYTVNNSSVYTVKQVADVSANGDTYVPGGANNGTDLAQYHQTGFTNDYKIDKKHITLNGKAGTGSFARVYGNEDTVYLNAELGNLTNDGGKWGVIKDVDTVTVAAENVNLTVWTDAQAQTEAENSSSPSVALSGNEYATKGVYTLYDDDGIVIAAVVVGEDEGSARNLVYVHSGSIESESYNGSSSSRAAGDGMWTWTRKVIQNGEEVTLTEVSDGNSDLEKMQQYHWYQIKTNADGEVTGVYRLDQDNRTTGDWATTAKHRSLPAANLDRYDDYALSYLPYTDDKGVTLGEIAYTVQNGASTVLYWNENLINSRLRMDGRTLYVATNDQTGFIVNSNVKWVVQQWDNNKKETYIDDGTTASGLKSMIDEVNRRYTNGQNYTYQVSAVIESGIASSVVIYFNENDYNRPSTPVVDTGMLKWDRTTETWTLTVPAGVDVDALTTTQVRDYLIEAGCTDIVKTRDGWTFTLDGTEYENQIVKVEAKAGAVAVTGVTLDKGTASVKVGETVTLTATVAPADAANKNVTWRSSDTSVATVSDGVVSGVGAGTAKITVTTADGGKTAECDVTVTVPGDGYAVTVKGTALEDNHYSTDLPAGGEVTKGESFTITALKKIVVYDETGRTVVKKGETYDVTPTKDITVVINRTKLERGENNTMVEVEDTNADTPAAGGVAIMAMFARAAARVAEPDYQRLIITDADGKDHEYIVKVVTGADGMSTIYFPSAESVAEAVEILNAADLANKGGDMDLVDDATDEEIEESWGSENPVTVDEIDYTTEPWTIKLSYTVTVTEDQIKAAINDKLEEDGKTEVVATIYADAAWAADGMTKIGVIESTVGFYIYVDGKQLKDAEGEAVVVTPETEEVKIPDDYLEGVYYLANAADWTEGYPVEGIEIKSVTLDAAALADWEADLKLVSAYKLGSVENTIASVTYTDSEERTVQQSAIVAQQNATPVYIPTDASVTFTAAAGQQQSTHSKLTIGGKTVETKAATEDPAEYAVDMADLTSEMLDKGDIKEVAEAGAFAYTIKLGTVEVKWEAALGEIKLENTPAMRNVKLGNYLLSSDLDGKKYVAVGGQNDPAPTTVAEGTNNDAGKIVVTLAQGVEPDENGVIELVPVTAVAFDNAAAGDVSAFIIAGDEVSMTNDAVFAMVPGTAIRFVAEDGVTIKVITADENDEDVDITSGWTVPEDEEGNGVDVIVLKGIDTVALSAKTVTAGGALVLEKAAQDDATLGEIACADTNLAAEDAEDKCVGVAVTVAAGEGYCFVDVPEISDITTVAATQQANGASFVVKDDAEITEDGSLTFTVDVTTIPKAA